MASEFARKCWEIGVPLNDAWEKFAPTELKEEYGKLPNFGDAMIQGFDPDNPMSAFTSIHQATQISVEKGRVESAMKEALLTDLFNGELIATGYREYPSIGQIPVRIDPDKFEFDDPDWRKHTFAADGVRYGRIRICDPRDLENSNQQATRKGSIEPIDLAIDHLKSIDPQFGDIPRKQACQLVRDYLGQNHKIGNGLSDQNISKAIVRKCGKRKIQLNYN